MDDVVYNTSVYFKNTYKEEWLTDDFSKEMIQDASEVQTPLGLRFVLFPGPSSSGDEVFGERQCCDLTPPRHSVIWV